jgi:hypothetical protein
MTMWQPIETAPKDGSWFWAYRPPAKSGEWDTLVTVAWCDVSKDFIWPDDRNPFDPFSEQQLSGNDEPWYIEGDFYEARGSFTDWMPLPAPPAPKTPKD